MEIVKKSKVVTLHAETRLDIPSDRVLESAVGKLNGVVVIGWGKDNEDLYFASSIADSAEVMWLLENARFELISLSRQEDK